MDALSQRIVVANCHRGARLVQFSIISSHWCFRCSRSTSNRVTRLVLWVTHYVPFRPFRARSILFHGWNDPIRLRLTYS
jgi:hypothetical protein